MQTILIILVAALTIFSFSAAAYARDGGKGAKILLTIEGREYPAVLYDNPAAKDLFSHLPVTLSLNMSRCDYCGDIPALKYDRRRYKTATATDSSRTGYMGRIL